MMEPAPSGIDEQAWVAGQRQWALGWRRVVFPSIFLAWTIQVAEAIPNDSHGVAQIFGFIILIAFCVCYVVSIPSSLQRDQNLYKVFVLILGLLFLAELPFAHADAFVMGIFVSSITVMRFGEKALVIPGLLTVLAIFLPPAVSSWHDSIGTGFSNGTAISIPLTGLAMLGFGHVIRGNRALANARSEIARLAAENERTRIARDLHDLLGHSLTTITVKAELASRLSQHDVTGAVREIDEVAALSRRALGDVRAAVSNYREVTLAGELATGRELLRAAGIVAELPPAAAVVDDSTQELFGWVLREGLTNVVRHSHARNCTVRISASSVEIVDDGVGMKGACGNGLTGLAERVAAVGGVIEAGPADPNGWRLAVQLTGASL